MRALARPLPERLAGGGVLGLGLSWGLGTAAAHRERIEALAVSWGEALVTVVLGALLSVTGIWLGVASVSWAMGRLLGGRARFAQVLFAVSSAAPLLWPAALALALMPRATASGEPAAGLALAVVALGGLGFAAALVAALQRAQAFSPVRAAGCAALVTVFCASCLSLR